MSFQFRFQSILQLRLRQRDEARAAVGQANEAIAKIDSQSREVAAEREMLRRESGGSRQGDLRVDAMLSQGRYDVQLEAQENSLADTRGKLEQELSRRQQLLVDAEAELKRFERLRDKEQLAHQANVLRQEQNEMDEAINRRYAMAHRNGAVGNAALDEQRDVQ